MPNVNGLQAAANILRENPSIPLALYSLHEISILENQAKAIGVTKFISKADVFASLIPSLQEALARAAAAPAGAAAPAPDSIQNANRRS